MKLLDFFLGNRPRSADAAKDRLQLIIVRDRAATGEGPDFLPMLQKDLIEVVRKYVDIGDDKVSVDVDRRDNLSMLEVNIELPGRYGG
ncbi:MAG: cell division topological specificity factor MinE [Alphaproteobacteria bacterium]|nr:cell division topological specificity factor MinE [Alphaproteobacteria bacterium]